MVRKAKPYRQTIGNSGTAKPEAVGPSGSMLVRIPDSLCVRYNCKERNNSMKKRLLSKILAVLVAFFIASTALAADYIAEVQMSGQTRDQITDEQRFDDLQKALNYGNEGSTVYLLDNCSISASSYAGVLIAKDEQTLGLNAHTLTIKSEGSGPVVGVSNNNKNFYHSEWYSSS